jgi:hypothetical protein
MLNRVIGVDFQTRYNSKTPEWILTSYWGNNFYWANQHDAKELLNVIDLIKQQSKPNLKKGTTIYASKASEIPRFKLKEFIKDNNLKKTSRHKYSDVIIINKGYFNELSKYINIEEYDFCTEFHTKNKIKNLISKIDRNNSSVTTYNTTTNYNMLVYVRTDRNNLERELKRSQSIRQEYEQSVHSELGVLFNFYREHRLVELLTMLVENKDRIKKGLVKFVFDEDFFVDLNKDGIELDDDYLQTLRDMLFSSDEANIKLGFEMMSNLVIDQPTLLSISFLLNELVHTTKFRPSYYTSSNTNLKSLLKMLKTKGIYWDRDWKTFGTGLRINFKDGKEGDIVKKFLLDNINREFKLSNSASEALVDIVFTTEVNELSLI